jgi:transglutaminase-like putative cysteine protease
MQIQAGYRIAFDCAQPMPILLKLSVHPDRRHDLIVPDILETSVSARVTQHTDEFGNLVTRVRAPAGPIVLSSRFIIKDSGEPDRQNWDARQVPVEDLPAETLPFLLASRYCETDLMSNLAWSLFGCTRPGWARVQAIVDYAHQQIAFGYPYARPTRTALEAHDERVGVCRDYAHLAVTLCRAMNIPARYCNGYLGDFGVPHSDAVMDFSAWFEVYLEGGWYTFDARHNRRRIGRVVIARGRDAADVAMTHTFGTAWLTEFEVTTEQIEPVPTGRLMAAE